MNAQVLATTSSSPKSDDGLAIGLFMLQTKESIAPHRLAVEAESRGFESVWFTEHTNIPTSRATPYPKGGELPMPYRQLLDPFACLAAAAVVTERITLATGVCLAAQRDPIITAKEVSTIDVLSDGRVQLGVGFGWNREEMANHGRDPRRRWDIARECVLVMRELWTQEEARFTGEHISLEPCWQWPKPVQRPHPPVLIGGMASPTTFDRIAEFGDGWLPLSGAEAVDLASALPQLSVALEKRDRELSEIDVVPYGIEPVPARLDGLRELGVRRVVFRLPTASEDDVLPILDEYQKFIE